MHGDDLFSYTVGLLFGQGLPYAAVVYDLRFLYSGSLSADGNSAGRQTENVVFTGKTVARAVADHGKHRTVCNLFFGGGADTHGCGVFCRAFF